MERQIMTWQREEAPDGLHPLFDDILRRQLMFDKPVRGAKEDHKGSEQARMPAGK